MTLTSIVYAVGLLLLSIVVQLETSHLIALSNKHRREVLTSGDRCPKISQSPNCHLKIAARHDGLWEHCDDTVAPSGANLPMHRWFRITGTCHINYHRVNIPLPLAPQLVYR